MGKHKDSIDAKIRTRLQSKEPGWVFTPADLSDLGSRTAVASALMRAKTSGHVHSLARGFYYRTDPADSDASSPTVDSVIRAVQARDAIRLQASGAYAANQLGLSNQVPMRVVFLTDGRQQNIKLGKMEIRLKHTTPRNMATAGRVSGLAIQAFRWLGRNQATASAEKLKNTLDTDAKKQLLADAQLAPVWIAGLFKDIAESSAKRR